MQILQQLDTYVFDLMKHISLACIEITANAKGLDINVASHVILFNSQNRGSVEQGALKL